MTATTMTVTGAGVGTDTLTSVESIRGTNYDDNYNAVGWTGASVIGSVPPNFNEFEGMGGTDHITGSGNTKLSYAHATGAVTVDIAAGTADGDASVGHDVFTGVNYIRGSDFNDNLFGSNNPAGTVEGFEGGGGDNLI